ncbi:phosphoadenosine phosphosulfate reductase family protein [Desulfosporosinus sp. FKB]|uniref:phosphoadenosine phosphosulfate reductase family protein n=1 Tax=Desulfosporosinus sp. FKB TaxID=1969835 RepID=UPI001482D0AA|nr:phosphoadenosine phosphosulfate reductase family protein [Desulfosporosinus sp. FKB]
MNYVAVSGGADSTALALLLWERGEDFEMVFSDTGGELPETYWILPRLAQRIDKKLNVVSNGSFFQHLVQYGFLLPGPRMRWCTKLVKMVPQRNFFNQIRAEKVFVGIRADEPRRLERKNTEKYENAYPLAEAGMGKKDVKALCANYDLLNPVYEWRSNVSCFFCFFQKKRDWLGLLKHHPTLYGVAEEWERQSSITTKQGWGWNQRFTLSQLRVADEQQLKLWPEPDAEPCLICSL